MFSKFLKDFMNFKKIILNIGVLIILIIIGILFLINFDKLNNVLKFIISCTYISIIVVLVILNIFCIYDDWYTENIINELNTDKNKHEIIRKYKIKLPIEKEFDVGYITRNTSYLSNLLNILVTVQMIMIVFITGFSYEVYKDYNFLGMIVAYIMSSCIITIALIIESKNNSYIKIKKVLLEQNIKVNNTINYEEFILKSKFKLFWSYIFIASLFIQIITLINGNITVKNQVILGVVLIVSIFPSLIGSLIYKKMKCKEI